MKTIAKHRKGRLEWILSSIDTKEVKTKMKFKDSIEATPDFILQIKFSVVMNVWDEPTNSLINTYEALSSELPCGYAKNFPAEVKADTPIGDFLGSNQYTWFRKETLVFYPPGAKHEDKTERQETQEGQHINAS